MRAVGFLLIITFCAVGFRGGARAADDAGRKAFLARRGTDLLMDGKPFRAASVIKYDIAIQFLRGGDEREKAAKAIRDLSKMGFRVIRCGAIGFYPKDMELWPNDEYWKRMDDLVAVAREAGVWLIPTVVWNGYLFPDMAGETMQDMMTNKDSRSRQLVELYIHQIVSRYKDEPTILFWDLWNELDLGADLEFMRPYGFSELNAVDQGAATMRVRRDNYTSEQMIAFMRELAQLVRSIDKNHLISSGYAAPRYAAQHLRAAKGKGDWTEDSPGEAEQFIRDTHPDPIDIISLHFYPKVNNMSFGNRDENSAVSITKLKEICDRVGKPVYIGESCGNAYAELNGQAPAFTRDLLERAVKADYPIVLCWLGFSHDPLRFDLEKARPTLELLRKADRELQK